MSLIHSTAIVSPKARIGSHVEIGPYAIIEEDVTIGDQSTVLGHAHIGKGTTIGKHNRIHMGAVIGHEAQHLAAEGVRSFLNIGDDNVFREYVTVHRGATEESCTTIGNHNYFMAFAHLGHDCRVMDHVVVTNASLIGGHALLEDHCILSGGSGVHQHCRVGRYAMVGGYATITKDLPPYMLVDDGQDLIGSVNLVGMRRAGFSEAVKRDIKNAYKLLYLSGLNLTNALEAILSKCHSAEVSGLVEFMKDSKRGILGHRRRVVPHLT